MKPTRYGEARYGDPNVRYGYTLEPGDPGYVPPSPQPRPRKMNDRRKFNFPLSTLLSAADALVDALGDTDYSAAMQARLGDDTATPPVVFATDFAAAIAALRAEIANQTGKTGEAGNLTEDQRAALAEVERLTAGARRSARQAMPDAEVVLRTEFQVGINEPNDLGSRLDRAGKTLAAAQKYAAELKTKGWLPADATALQTALGQLTGVALDQDEALADRVQFTAEVRRKANTVYEDCLAIQNAARLQYPSTQPGTEAARTRFKLDTFPPRDRSEPDGGTQGGSTPPPPPPNP